jgi:hypothetical protein
MAPKIILYAKHYICNQIQTILNSIGVQLIAFIEFKFFILTFMISGAL